MTVLCIADKTVVMEHFRANQFKDSEESLRNEIPLRSLYIHIQDVDTNIIRDWKYQEIASPQLGPLLKTGITNKIYSYFL